MDNIRLSSTKWTDTSRGECSGVIGNNTGGSLKLPSPSSMLRYYIKIINLPILASARTTNNIETRADG